MLPTISHCILSMLPILLRKSDLATAPTHSSIGIFKITNVIPYELAVEKMKYAIVKSYGKKGERCCQQKLCSCWSRWWIHQDWCLPAEWAFLPTKMVWSKQFLPLSKNIVVPINAQAGDDIPVSAFKGRWRWNPDSGYFKIRKTRCSCICSCWDKDNCIQCNQCAYVCPHAAIRPFLLDAVEAVKSSVCCRHFESQRKTVCRYDFRIQVDVLDCMGCDNCAEVCPGNKTVKHWKWCLSKLNTKIRTTGISA